MNTRQPTENQQDDEKRPEMTFSNLDENYFAPSLAMRPVTGLVSEDDVQEEMTRDEQFNQELLSIVSVGDDLDQFIFMIQSYHTDLIASLEKIDTTLVQDSLADPLMDALLDAAQKKREDIAVFIIQMLTKLKKSHPKLDLKWNALTDYELRRTGLHNAAVFGSLKTVKAYVEAGANMNVIDDSKPSGMTPLQLAQRYGKREVADYLSNKLREKEEKRAESEITITTVPAEDNKVINKKDSAQIPIHKVGIFSSSASSHPELHSACLEKIKTIASSALKRSKSF